MPNTETPSSNPFSMSSEASHGVASQYPDDDGASPEERIRRRAYELYVERGRQPGDEMADWVRAEREYYGQP